MLNALSSLSFPGKQPRKKLRIVTVNSITNDLAIFKTQCSSFTMSSNAQYILFGTETGIYLSTDSGASFSAKSSFSPFGSDNYQSAISDTGNVILLYQPNVTNGTIYLSTDGATTFASKQLSASGLSLCSVVMSLTGQYIIASGSGMGGGVYVSQNYGSSFNIAVSNSSAQGCACSPNGRTIVVAAAGTSPWVSTDYGSTFSTFGPNTFYQGRRAFVHPDETSFAIRAVAEDAFLYTDLSIANSALTATKYNASSSYVEVPSDKDGYSGMDQNGRLYFINGEILYSFDSSTFTTKTVVPNLNGVTFADSRLCVSYDGKYILGYTGTRLRLVQQYSETNTVTISSSSIDTYGTATINFSLAITPRPLWITWTPKTNTNQPVEVPSGTTSVSFNSGATRGISYTFTVFSRTSDGLFITGKTVSSATSIPALTADNLPLVSNLTYTATSSTAVSISWTPPSDPVVTSYAIEISPFIDGSANGYKMLLWYNFETTNAEGKIPNLAYGMFSRTVPAYGNIVGSATISTSSAVSGTKYLQCTGSTSQGGSFNMSGDSGYIPIDNSNSSSYQPTTISFFFNTPRDQNWAHIVNLGNGTFLSGQGKYNVVVGNGKINSGKLSTQTFYNNGSGGANYLSFIVTANTWYHVAITIDASGNMKIYVDGSLSYNNITERYVDYSVNRNFLWLGASQWGDVDFNGKIDDFRMYQSVLSATQIQQIYSTSKTTTLGKQTGSVTSSSIPFSSLTAGYSYKVDVYSVTSTGLKSTNARSLIFTL